MLWLQKILLLLMNSEKTQLEKDKSKTIFVIRNGRYKRISTVSERCETS